jgi:hypothetical protein
MKKFTLFILSFLFKTTLLQIVFLSSASEIFAASRRCPPKLEQTLRLASLKGEVEELSLHSSDGDFLVRVFKRPNETFKKNLYVQRRIEIQSLRKSKSPQTPTSIEIPEENLAVSDSGLVDIKIHTLKDKVLVHIVTSEKGKTLKTVHTLQFPKNHIERLSWLHKPSSGFDDSANFFREGEDLYIVGNLRRPKGRSESSGQRWPTFALAKLLRHEDGTLFYEASSFLDLSGQRFLGTHEGQSFFYDIVQTAQNNTIPIKSFKGTTLKSAFQLSSIPGDSLLSLSPKGNSILGRATDGSFILWDITKQKQGFIAGQRFYTSNPNTQTEFHTWLADGTLLIRSRVLPDSRANTRKLYSIISTEVDEARTVLRAQPLAHDSSVTSHFNDSDLFSASPLGRLAIAANVGTDRIPEFRLFVKEPKNETASLIELATPHLSHEERVVGIHFADDEKTITLRIMKDGETNHKILKLRIPQDTDDLVTE